MTNSIESSPASPSASTETKSSLDKPGPPKTPAEGAAIVPTISAGQQTVRASADPSVVEMTLAEREWKALERRLAQQDKMIEAMIKIFTWLNGAVVLFVLLAWGAEFWGRKQIITEHVVMSLIGATIIQAGIAFITITKFLFPNESDKNSGNGSGGKSRRQK